VIQGHSIAESLWGIEAQKTEAFAETIPLWSNQCRFDSGSSSLNVLGSVLALPLIQLQPLPLGVVAQVTSPQNAFVGGPIEFELPSEAGSQRKWIDSASISRTTYCI
jgi:hypothetical protein